MKRTTILFSGCISLLCATPVSFSDDNKAGSVPSLKIPDPFAAVKVEHAGYPEREVLTYEAFSLPIDKAGEIMRLHLTDPDLYNKILATGKLERLLASAIRSGRRMDVSNTTEFLYPMEFTSSCSIFGPPAPPVNPRYSGVPDAITMRPLGDRIEIDPVFCQGNIELNFSMEHSALVKIEKWGQGLEMQQRPRIDSQKIQTAVSAKPGAPCLIGTLSPTYGNGASDHKEQRVWFCFVTVTHKEMKPVAPMKNKK